MIVRLVGMRGLPARIESTLKGTAMSDLALNGNCAVALIETGELVSGDPEITTKYMGYTYAFPEQEALEMFEADPGKYAISYRGYCPVAAVDASTLALGDKDIFSLHRSKSLIVLFGADSAKQVFDADPERYTQHPAS